MIVHSARPIKRGGSSPLSNLEDPGCNGYTGDTRPPAAWRAINYKHRSSITVPLRTAEFRLRLCEGDKKEGGTDVVLPWLQIVVETLPSLILLAGGCPAAALSTQEPSAGLMQEAAHNAGTHRKSRHIRKQVTDTHPV